MKKMTFDATKEITEKIEQALQGSFVPHGRQDVLTAAIERPEHPGHVRVAGVSVTIKQYFGSAPQTSHTSSSMAPIELEDQLEESVTEKVTRQLMASFSQMQSQFQSQMQAQGLALPTEPEVGPLDARVSTKESCVDPSGNDPDTGESNKCGLYIEENPPRLVALGRVYEGSITVHNIPLLHDQVKVGVEEVKDAAAPIPVPTDKDKQGAMGPAKPAYRLNHEVDDPLHLTETSMRAGNSDVYGFLEPHYMKNWMRNSKCDVYLEAYLNGAHWQMVVILPKENLIIWFCSLHNRPNNYLKGIINSVIDKKEALSVAITILMMLDHWKQRDSRRFASSRHSII
ncbi:hypothetical protein HKD37_07G018882 [Glycine soja]